MRRLDRPTMIVVCVIVLILVALLMFVGPKGKNVRYQNGPTTIECHTSGPDVTYCISATSVVRTPAVQPR